MPVTLDKEGGSRNGLPDNVAEYRNNNRQPYALGNNCGSLAELVVRCDNTRDMVIRETIYNREVTMNQIEVTIALKEDGPLYDGNRFNVCYDGPGYLEDVCMNFKWAEDASTLVLILLQGKVYDYDEIQRSIERADEDGYKKVVFNPHEQEITFCSRSS